MNRSRHLRGVEFLLLQHLLDVAGQIVHAEVADGDSKVVAGDVLQFVGFVEDDSSAVGEDSGVGRALGLEFDGEIGEKQVVIDDDDVALGRATPHLGDEAAVVVFTFLAEAGVGAGIELVPNGAGLGQFGEFGAVSGLRCLLPGGDGAVVLDLFESAEDGLVCEIDEFLAAEIVVASLHVTDAEFAVAFGKQRAFEGGDVFEEKLLLQVFCAGGDDDAFARPDDGQQISQRFAGAGAGFDDQVTLLFERFFDGLSHLQLAAAKFIGGVRF